MKIVQITPYFLPHKGGIEQYVFNLSKYLVKRGHQVEVITSDIPAGLKKEEIQGISITRLKSYGEPLRNPIIPDILFMSEYLNNFDVINIHTIYAFSSLFAGIKSSALTTPIVLTHHGNHKFGSFVKDTLVHGYEFSIARKIINNIDCSITLTSSDAGFLSAHGMNEKRIRVIPNGIDIAEFEGFNDLDPLLIQESLLLKNKFIVLFVGVITDRKGIKYLIRAMSEIKNHISDEEIALLVIGTGPDIESMRELVKKLNLEKYIFLQGQVSDRELMHYYKAAHLFVLPSLSEGMPTVILEAFYFNVPVITTDIPNLREVFKDVAMLVPPENESALAAAILDVYHNKSQTHQNSQKLNYKEYVESRYSWSVLSGEYEAIYQKLHNLRRK